MNIIERGKTTLLLESENLKMLSDKLDSNFENAVKELFNIRGRVITSGVGKSGHIARKAAATFASTGTPSFFVDPNECMHGDFGMITKTDCCILYSKGGESREIIELVNWLCRQNIPYIAITNEINSTLLKLTHDIRLIKVTIGNHNNIIQVLDNIKCSARAYSNFMIYTASDALKYLTDWKIYFELANEDKQNELSAQLAIASMNDLTKTQEKYKKGIKEKEKELYTNITEYLSLLKRLYMQDFYLKFDFVDISEQKPEA